MTKHYRVVLEAGDHAVVRSEATVALEALNAGTRERGAEEWVFSCSLATRPQRWSRATSTWTHATQRSVRVPRYVMD